MVTSSSEVSPWPAEVKALIVKDTLVPIGRGEMVKFVLKFVVLTVMKLPSVLV